jgi:hypothetical protein
MAYWVRWWSLIVLKAVFIGSPYGMHDFLHVIGKLSLQKSQFELEMRNVTFCISYIALIFQTPIAPLPRTEHDAISKAGRLMLCNEINVTAKIKRNL